MIAPAADGCKRLSDCSSRIRCRMGSCGVSHLFKETTFAIA
jgi:hypothetical protein